MTRRSVFILVLAAAAAVFAAATYVYKTNEAGEQTQAAVTHADRLVRPHSPVMGPANARVTIVEFFDPSCEACRAFFPHVKKILADNPSDVRLVLRYAPFHQGSDEAVRILEAARLQNKFEPVLEALVAAQPMWAIHGAPNLTVAWDLAKAAGLDLDRARKDATKPEIDEVLRMEVEDIKAIKLNRTPTFYVNAQPLFEFSPDGLAKLVRSEINRARDGTKR